MIECKDLLNENRRNPAPHWLPGRLLDRFSSLRNPRRLGLPVMQLGAGCFHGSSFFIIATGQKQPSPGTGSEGEGGERAAPEGQNELGCFRPME